MRDKPLIHYKGAIKWKPVENVIKLTVIAKYTRRGLFDKNVRTGKNEICLYLFLQNSNKSSLSGIFYWCPRGWQKRMESSF